MIPRERDLLEIEDQWHEPEGVTGLDWMTRLCECGHVDRIHEDGNICRGWVVSPYGGWPCRCEHYVHQSVIDLKEAM